jgi:hypothetical protein
MRVMSQRVWRVAPLAAALVVGVLGLWLGLAIVDRPDDGAVRHGISTSATVTAVGDGHATIRYWTAHGSTAGRVRIQPGRTYEMGRSVAVVYDPYDLTHVSERGLPPSAGAGPRALVLLLTFAAAMGACALVQWRRPPDLGDHRVGGGRERVGVREPAAQPAS